MLNHIKIKATDALNETVLKDLGRINVVCGKNNSGKSTLLAGLVDPARRVKGVAIAKTHFHQLALYYADGGDAYIRPDSYLTDHGRLLVSAFESMEEKVWFQNDAENYVNSVVSAYKKVQPLNRLDVVTAKVRSGFESLFAGPEEKAVLISPKRNVETEVSIQKANVSPNGMGLLNFLFHAKNQEVGTKARTHFEIIEQEFKSISSGFEFSLVPDQRILLNLRFKNPNGIYAEATSCGLGLQDLLVILYFATSSEFSLVLIEEPESHFHPEMQRKLLGFLAKMESKQFFLTTHSNIFLDSTFVDKVFFTQADKKISVRDETNRAMILSDLGYQVTDNLVSDMIVLVEGPTDVPVYEHFLVEMKVIPKYLVKFWPLGGDIMSQLDLSVFSERYKIIAIIDRDPKSKKIRELFKKKCEQSKIPVFQLKKYALENYFSLAAVRAVFKSQVSEALQKITPDKKVEDQLGFNIKNNNRNIARHMGLEDIADTDLLTILQEISSQCKKNTA